ncbi:unnamed protein product [Camellia sinensis]
MTILLELAAVSTHTIIMALIMVKTHIHLFMGMITHMEVAITTRFERLWWTRDGGMDITHWWIEDITAILLLVECRRVKIMTNFCFCNLRKNYDENFCF